MTEIETARHLLQALGTLGLSPGDLKILMKAIPAFDSLFVAYDALMEIRHKAKTLEDFALRYANGETPLGDLREFSIWLMGRLNLIRHLTGDTNV